MNRLFPDVSSPLEFERVARDERVLRPGIAAICDVLHLTAPMLRFAEGSLPVYAAGEDLVLKIYPPLYYEERDREATVLRVVEKRLPIPTPAVRAIGALEGWGYVLMERLRGENLAHTWPRLRDDEREKLATELGGTLQVLHSIRDASLEVVKVDWPAFLEKQRESAVTRQRNHGVEERWLEQIPDFLATPLSGAPAECLLHTEVMREHLLVAENSSGWSFSGIFDFEPALIGAPEYEFASVGLFFSCGTPVLLRRVLLAYGYEERELNADLERRLLAYTLLHKYSNLAWYLNRLPPPKGTNSLEALAAHWWGVA